jgi:hypothetical protein
MPSDRIILAKFPNSKRGSRSIPNETLSLDMDSSVLNDCGKLSQKVNDQSEKVVKDEKKIEERVSDISESFSFCQSLLTMLITNFSDSCYPINFHFSLIPQRVARKS